ncbi:MAG: hypothetical protein BWY83_01605 [bacterium ADurb.Bin478]|nr:MAG: hypothetical protein BWY83_01605 [bacterium ADurb.Bin478]
MRRFAAVEFRLEPGDGLIGSGEQLIRQRPFDMQHRQAGGTGAVVVNQGKQDIALIRLLTRDKQHAHSAPVLGHRNLFAQRRIGLKAAVGRAAVRRLAQDHHPAAADIEPLVIPPRQRIRLNMEPISCKRQRRAGVDRGGKGQRSKILHQSALDAAKRELVFNARFDAGDDEKFLQAVVAQHSEFAFFQLFFYVLGRPARLFRSRFPALHRIRGQIIHMPLQFRDRYLFRVFCPARPNQTEDHQPCSPNQIHKATPSSYNESFPFTYQTEPRRRFFQDL